MCNWTDLLVLHKVNKRTETGKLQSTADILYLDRLTYNRKVLLNASKVIMNCDRFLGMYTVLDDGSQQSSLLLYNQPRKRRGDSRSRVLLQPSWTGASRAQWIYCNRTIDTEQGYLFRHWTKFIQCYWLALTIHILPQWACSQNMSGMDPSRHCSWSQALTHERGSSHLPLSSIIWHDRHASIF